MLSLSVCGILVFGSGAGLTWAQLPSPIPITERPINGVGELELRRFKPQPLQSAAIESGVFVDMDDQGLDRHFTEVSIGSGIPLGSFENILGVTPRFRVDWIEAESSIDVPDRLYDGSVQFFHRKVWGPRVSTMAIVSPSIRSDFTTDSDAFRFFALGLVHWDWIPERLTLSGGAVALGRADLPVLPAIGLRWTPTVTTELSLQFPMSRWRYRLAKQGGTSEQWLYAAAGIGGNTWAVTRQDGSSDELSLGDFRLLVGVEQLLDGGGRSFLELGAALNRDLEYENDAFHLDLGDALLFRAGWRY